MTAERLGARGLRRSDGSAAFDFDTTADLEPLGRLVGQDRALEALDFGVAIESPGFNIFVLGEEGSGRRSATLDALERQARRKKPPDDWCYINNYDDPRRPKAMRLPPGMARQLASDMEAFVAELASELPRVFGSDEYTAQRSAILEELQTTRQHLLEDAERKTDRLGVAVVPGAQTVRVTPKREGRPLSGEEIERLSPEERKQYEKARGEVQEHFEQALQSLAEATAAAQERLRHLNQRTAQAAAAHLLQALHGRYHDVAVIGEFLGAVEQDLLEVINQLVVQAEAEPDTLTELVGTDEFQRRYAVNVLLSHDGDGAPVEEEPNPTFANLLGRIEHRVLQGMLTTDFLMIRAGALLRANGGYLLIDALEVLRQPLAWDALKRTLKQGELRIEEPGAELGAVTTVSLEPEPVPLDVKVVLLGSPMLYYLLHTLDPDFANIFKVKSDFADTIPRSPDAEMEYARFVATRCRNEEIPHFDEAAVRTLIEFGARRAGDRTRLSAQLGEIADVIREAGFHARGVGRDRVGRSDVEATIGARIRRANRLEEELQRQIADGTLIVRTRGRAAGQVNGLSVLTAGDHAFAKPVRVSATVTLGTRGVVDMEREADLGGPIHSKGVLILSGFMNRRYGGDRPLVLSATLGFEQLYEEIEGDSASAAELIALLSALSELPVDQSIGVTGSVNQHGEIQPVGGVTEKVEGFYNACRIQGPTDAQGVVLPARNVQHLMVRPDVVDAVDEGWFHLYAAQQIDDVIELVFDRPAAEVHRAVEQRLDGFVDAWKTLQAEAGALPGPRPPTGGRRRARADRPPEA